MAAVRNERPSRLPIYEHLIDSPFMEKCIGQKFAELEWGDRKDQKRFFEIYCGFFKDKGYDMVSYEFCVGEILPEGGALFGERPGPIQTRKDFEEYPWNELPKIFWDVAGPRFKALKGSLPDGMKAIGGIGSGIFEISEDLVGFERLCYMQLDDPDLFADLYNKIGELLLNLWSTFIENFGDVFPVFRIGDDMGYKTGTLMAPATLITHVVGPYRRIIGLIHDSNHPFLLHSCGKIFDIMDELIDAGINAKHSNEDVIAPFEEWIDRYGNRIGLLGGIDTDLVARMDPDSLFELVLDRGRLYREKAKGFALGSGNSIPKYIPVENYEALIRAGQQLKEETQR